MIECGLETVHKTRMYNMQQVGNIDNGKVEYEQVVGNQAIFI